VRDEAASLAAASAALYDRVVELRRGGLHATPDDELRRVADSEQTDADRAEDGLITREISEDEGESGEHSDDTGARLEDWREAERDIDDTDPDSEEGIELRERAVDARTAFHDAESAQRQRHGFEQRSRPR
jgi:hypothetical protein